MSGKKTYGFSFSWKRALGISGLRQKLARRTGVPTTLSGMERKTGSLIIRTITDSFSWLYHRIGNKTGK
ncbi:MAG: hypothetical protein DBY00_06950 [Flavobacteriales bacterium]|nr:MAG: hypothetical protein DBY00_06950 [Flavobacteriales bacterium]